MDDLDSRVDPVVAWRVEQFEEVGFDSTTALQLASASYVDLDRARLMRKAGCPLLLIADILS